MTELEFIKRIGRTLWAQAYADWYEDDETTERQKKGAPHPKAKQDWMDFAPPTPSDFNIFAGIVYASYGHSPEGYSPWLWCYHNFKSEMSRSRTIWQWNLKDMA